MLIWFQKKLKLKKTNSMFLGILNKILMSIFFMSCLTTIRHSYFFIQAILTSTDEQPVRYRLSTYSLIFLGVSIAYILSTIFTGFIIK